MSCSVMHSGVVSREVSILEVFWIIQTC